MKIALIGDIHANLPALKAVAAHAQSQKAELIINTGDFVGYGPFPNQTVQWIKDKEIVSVIGNYDQKVLRIPKKEKKWKNKKKAEKLTAFLWAFQQLSEDSKKYLSSLPQQQRFELMGKKCLITHGSPDDIEEHLRKKTPKKRFGQIAQKYTADIIIFGHSHEPFAFKMSHTWFINPGSVGRPDDGDKRASYALLHIQPGYFRIRHFRVDYPVNETINALKKNNLPSIFSEMIREGRNMDFLHDEKKDIANPMNNNLNETGLKFEQVQKIKQWSRQLVPEHFSHCQQVSFLATQIFDHLKPYHHLEEKARSWLEGATLLHDIGWVKGQGKHHKTAQEMILENKTLIPVNHDRKMIALIARYHRKALPKEKHAYFRDLNQKGKNSIKKLSAILRLADGLDWEHINNTEQLSCQIKGHQLSLTCQVKRKMPSEIDRALQKGKYFENIFNLSLSIFQITKKDVDKTPTG